MALFWKQYKQLVVSVLLCAGILLPAPKAMADVDDVNGLVLFSPMCREDFNIPDGKEETESCSSDGGNRILGGNCNALADPKDDVFKTDPNEKSCIGQGITLDQFFIRVRHDPTSFDGDSSILLLRPDGGRVGSSWLTDFSATMVGDRACVFAFLLGSGTRYGIPYDGAYIDPLEKGRNYSLAILGPSTDGLQNPLGKGLPWHCIPVPPPTKNFVKKSWPDIISHVCTDYDTTASQFRWTDGTSRSFTGVVVQCIEDTVDNLFTYVDTTPGGGNRTFFQKIQESMQGIIRGMLVIYVIMFGYLLITEKRVPDRQELMITFLRIAVVVYFAMGAGMTQLLPLFQGFMRDFSLIVMEAGTGDVAQATAAAAALESKQQDYLLKSIELQDARSELALNPTDIALQGQRDAALEARDLAQEEYYKTRAQAATFGYRYCDFRDLELLDPNIYVDQITGEYRGYMKLWDMIDCKVSKLLGIGINLSAPEQPHVLMVGVSLFFSSILGQVVFPLTIIFLVFITMVILRMIHMYLMAFIAIVMLIYMSPLVVPTLLFKYTRSMFDTWVRQLIAYSLQPVIMFTFLSFLFSAMDLVMYDGNHHFTPMTPNHKAYENMLCMSEAYSGIPSKDGLCRAQDFEAYFEAGNSYLGLSCDDPASPGCIYQTSFTVTKVSTSLGASRYDLKLEWDQTVLLLIGLLKLILVCFIAFAVLGLVETISNTITNAAGGGISNLSALPVASPGDMVNATVNSGAAVYRAGKGVVGSAAKGVEKLGKTAKTKRDAKLSQGAPAGGGNTNKGIKNQKTPPPKK